MDKWQAISRAFDMVAAELVTRVDGIGWTVYRVNNIVRIDIRSDKQ